jgi:hypothetical protein
VRPLRERIDKGIAASTLHSGTRQCEKPLGHKRLHPPRLPVANAELLIASDGVQQIIGIGSEVATIRGDAACNLGLEARAS